MTRFEYNDKFDQVVRMYAEATDDDRDLDDIWEELMDDDELPEWVDSDLTPYEIVYDKLLAENYHSKTTSYLNEAKEILKENGYILINDESYELDEALEGPATSKQLWTLFKLTKQDYRNKNLSKEDAFKMIGELLDKKKNGETTTKPTSVKKATPKAPDADSPVKIGEIYHRMWGYSMCINDYYKVIDVKGKKALVVELPKKAISGDLTQGKVVPIDVENPSRNEAVLALIKPDGTLRIKNSIHKYETYHQWDGEPDWEDHWD